MRKGLKILAVLSLAGLGWGLYRKRKYPLAKGYHLLNLFVVPGFLVRKKVAESGNRQLQKMGLPPVAPGLKRQSIHVSLENGMSVPVTVYEPAAVEKELPCLVYFHGGGFCFADAGYIHKTVMDYSLQSGCKVVFVHYRTSDQAAFPAPFEDCCAALRYVWDHSRQLGIDRNRIAVGGDSAGGALAAACTLWARDETDIRLCFQMLIYPVTDARMPTASMKKYTDSPLWNSRLNRNMWRLYLRNGCGKNPAYASPMEARDFSGFPDAYIEVEEFDCLHDEGIAYGKALARGGAKVQIEQEKGTFHGFDVFRNTSETKRMIRKRSCVLRRAFYM